MAGKVIALKTGESVTVGRSAAKAQFALAQDGFMSGLHFAVECGAGGCHVVDRKSSNGTLLNGAKIRDAMLANGDQIRAGETTFIVKIVPDGKIAEVAPQRLAAADAERPEREARSAGSPRKEVVQPSKAGPAAESGQAIRPAGSEQERPKPTKVGDSAAEEKRAAASLPRSLEADRSREAPEKNVVAGNEASASRAGLDAASGAPQRRGPGDVDVRLVADLGSESQQAAKSKDVTGADAQRASGRGATFRVAGWSFRAVPAKWQLQEGLGLQSEEGEFPSSVAVTQESLGAITLQQFVEFQINMLKGYLREAKIEPVLPPPVGGAEETMAVDVRHRTKDGRELVYRRIYARSGGAVGVLTITALASELEQVLQRLRPVLDDAEFQGKK
jgi:hypothetical protein